MANKAESPSDISAKRAPLGDSAEDELEISVARSLDDTRALGASPLKDKIEEYMGEIRAAAEVANYHLNGEFDGQSPESGNFGLDLIHPGYFGYDDWDNMPTLTGGSASDWIDSDTPDNLASGTSGFDGPAEIGDPAVHVILGYGSYAESPVVTRIKEEKNNNPYTAVTTEDAFRKNDLRIKWLDTPRVLSPQDTFAARVFAGEDGEDALYPFGVSFLESRKYRILDPADMAGSNETDIVVE